MLDVAVPFLIFALSIWIQITVVYFDLVYRYPHCFSNLTSTPCGCGSIVTSLPVSLRNAVYEVESQL